MAVTDNKKIRVLIVDDHAVVREGLAFLASVHEELEIVGQAENGVDAVEMAESLRPDVIVLDLLMPKMDGIEALGLIRNENPDSRILVLSSFSDKERVFAAINAGAVGYLLKNTSPKELIQAILDVHRGETPIHSSVVKKLMNNFKETSKPKKKATPLTERELEALSLVAQGLTNKEISERLSLSTRTVGVHVGNILDKLNLTNRTQAALWALKQGLVKSE